MAALHDGAPSSTPPLSSATAAAAPHQKPPSHATAGPRSHRITSPAATVAAAFAKAEFARPVCTRVGRGHIGLAPVWLVVLVRRGV